MAELGRAAVAIAAAPFRAEKIPIPLTRSRKNKTGRQDGQPAISAVSTAQASVEAKMPSQEPDVQYTAKNPAVPAATTVVIEAVERGDAMALLGDYAAARLLYRFAAKEGAPMPR